MRILTFNGSPRKNGNTSALLQEFERGATKSGADLIHINAEALDLKYCAGCLKCNFMQKCVIRTDDWQELSQKILAAEVLVFASPVYFHHLTAPLKKILDRFRSFMQVQITEQGLKHTPWQAWHKHFILLLSQGSPNDDDARPIIDLFAFIVNILGAENALTSIVGTRLAVANQVRMSQEELRALYSKLKLPEYLVEIDFHRNQQILKQCYQLGKKSRTQFD